MSEIGLKMMGNNDGVGKSISVDDKGRLAFKATDKRVFSNITIPAGEEIIAITEEVDAYSGFRLSATGTGSEVNGLEYSYSTANSKSGLFNDTRSYIREIKIDNIGTPRNVYSNDYPLNGRYVGIKIKNTTDSSRKPNSITLTLLSDTTISKVEEPKYNVSSVVDTFTFQSGVTTPIFETKQARTLMFIFKNINKSEKTIFLDGFTKNKGMAHLPVVNSDRIMEKNPLFKDGIYFVNVEGFERIRFGVYRSGLEVTVEGIFTNAQCPEPLDSPVRYQRITPEDGAVSGNFRAIEPLTDITLHEQTRLSNEYGEANGTQHDVFETGDVRLTGQTLFGPFQRVRIVSGAALLVLL